MAVNLFIWKEEKGTENYRLQINLSGGDAKKASVKRILKEFSEWQTVGEGASSRSKQKMFLLKREFDTFHEKMRWARNSGYRIVEINSKGREIVINRPKRDSDE